MTFIREFGLVPNRSSPDRFVKLTRWEERWIPVPGDSGMETKRLVPVSVELGLLEGKWAPVVITELPLTRWPVQWPRDAETETPALRDMRIRALRAAAHGESSAVA